MNETAAAPRGESRPGPQLWVSAPPHDRSADSVPRLMLITLAALVPGAVLAVPICGMHVLLVMALGIAAAAATEWVICIARRRQAVLIDGSACLTGLLLAFSLPPRIPLWAAPLGSVFAIAVVKMAMGGLGRNFLNPALAGRAFLALSFPAAFGAAEHAAQVPDAVDLGAFANLLIGYQGAWIGAASAVALLAGAAALWYFRIIDFSLPLAFLFSAFVLFWAGGMHGGLFSAAALFVPLFHIVTGGILLAALFMATDPVTSPASRAARLIAGAGCGLLTWLFHTLDQGAGGPMYAVLAVNCLVPWLDRLFVRKPLGLRRNAAAARNAAFARTQAANSTDAQSGGGPAAEGA